MEGLTINISWEYFLGIITGILALMVSAFGGILTVAYKGSARFTALETSMEWVKDTLKELRVTSDNESAGAFSSHSPINLKENGQKWLIDIEFDTIFEDGLKKFAFEQGTTIAWRSLV